MADTHITFHDIKYQNSRDECPYEIKKKIKYLVKFPEEEMVDDVYCSSVDSVHKVLKHNNRKFSKTMVYNYFSPKRALVGRSQVHLRGAEIFKV